MHFIWCNFYHTTVKINQSLHSQKIIIKYVTPGVILYPLINLFFRFTKKNCRFLQLLCEISHGSFRESGCRIDLNVTLILVSRTLWQWQLLCYSYLRKGLSISVSKEMSKGLILALTSWHREGLTFLFFVDCVNLWKV